ncbi:MAG: TolC family protein [Polyangia bacterium]
MIALHPHRSLPAIPPPHLPALAAGQSGRASRQPAQPICVVVLLLCASLCPASARGEWPAPTQPAAAQPTVAQPTVAQPGAEAMLWALEKPRVVGLPEAIAYAQANQPSLRAALDRVRAAQADAQVPRARWLPLAAAAGEAFAGTTNNTTAAYLNLPDVALPRIGATPVVNQTSWAPSASTLGALSITQELFDFGRIAAQSAFADAVVETERQRADAERLAIRLVVQESYFAVQGAKAVLRAAEGAYDRTNVHRQLAEAGVKSGLFAPIELTRAAADLARFEVDRIRAEGGVASARVVLAAAVGVADRLLDAREDQTPVAPLPALDQAIATGTRRDPLLLEARSRVHEQEAATQAIRTELRPELLLSGTFSGRAGGATPSSGPAPSYGGYLPDVANWDAGLILHWPFYDGTVTARARASTEREQLRRSELDAVALQEMAALQRAYLATQVARSALIGLEASLKAARLNYAQAEARWKAGLGNEVELADAEYLRTDAEIQLAGGQFELARARAVLGKLLAEPS